MMHHWYDRPFKNIEQILDVHHYSSISSTQRLARRKARPYLQGNIPYLFDRWVVYCAEAQTAGVGTHNRKWHSPPSKNIYATYQFDWPASKSGLIQYVPQIVSLTIIQLLEKEAIYPQIKWVNDILLNGKKLSGNLYENLGLIKNTSSYLTLLGVGINMNMEKKEVDMIDQSSTSLKIETHKKWDHVAFLKLLHHALFENMLHFLHNGFFPFMPLIQKRMAFLNTAIKVKTHFDTKIGILKGINPDGALILHADNTENIIQYGHIQPLSYDVNNES